MNLKFSSFSILIAFVCLSIIGASLIPLLNIKLSPSEKTASIGINYTWQGVSAKLIEQEVTSKLEGVFNTIKGVKEISSTSNKGKGNISIEFKDNMNMDALRFEIASLIRQSYSEFPEGVTYPNISQSTINENKSPVLSYSINANESPYYIKKYTENYIAPKLAIIKGVNKLDVYGAAPFEWVIEYNTDKLLQLHLTVNDIKNAINNHLSNQELGNGLFKSDNYDSEISLQLSYKSKNEINWNTIPIKHIGGRIIYLKHIAKVKYKEADVNSYYRINGLNTVNMTVYAENGVNTINLANTIKAKITTLNNDLRKGYDIRLTQDSTEYVVEELQKIQKRTFFSFIILLTLIIIINRSWKYLIVLFLSIITNLLIAIIFYYLLKVELQLYSFAGITISFGIIIDNSIIMIDHIRNKSDKKAFLAILASTLTTIGALMIIFLLEESQQADLLDFALVIAINIGVSLLVSLYYVPALLNKMNLTSKQVKFSRKRKRNVIKFTNFYKRIIFWMKRPSYKWALIVIFILGFGIPFHLLPKNLEEDDDDFFLNIYSKIVGNEWFANDVRPTLEKVIGGSLRLFTEHVFEDSYYSEVERTTLKVSGSMPDGCTIQQLNEVIMKMESYLSRFNQIELFETNISSHKNSSISIYFKEGYEFNGFPYALKNLLQTKAISLGGLDWTITGVGRGFSNASGKGLKQNRIILEGYNYDKLYSYAEQLKEQLVENFNSRVKDVEITSGGLRENTLYEYHLNFDSNKLADTNISENKLYDYLKNQVHSGQLASIIQNNEFQDVKLVSNKYKKFNVWDLKNRPITIQNRTYKLNQLASIEKKKTGNTIKKNNQKYRLTVAYDFLGTKEMAKKVRNIAVEQFEPKLALGYNIFQKKNKNWDKDEKTQYYYLFIVIVIIFFIGAILLESLKQPLAIISMIPISFIGAFLTFYIFDFNFDQGGYAAFILLCGISVNSALYIINDFNNLKKDYPNRNTSTLYFKAFNYKIIPVVLTIVSTIVGLLPFVWSGQNEAFWFSFAVGSIGGLIFSLIGIFIYLPIFSLKKIKCFKNNKAIKWQ
ncbi:efflux RND transporter permease subunit [Algibacter sp. R77976]|uniref:efflux RND transporter permease subunit n=1 Tax=Algibacter sp. R77976 TaxID=3093873 RepID=UPI0037C95E9A